jgi:hypothetical protein
VGLLHATFNATNNELLSKLLAGVDTNWLTPAATVVLAALVAVILWRRSPSAAAASPRATAPGRG